MNKQKNNLYPSITQFKLWLIFILLILNYCQQSQNLIQNNTNYQKNSSTEIIPTLTTNIKIPKWLQLNQNQLQKFYNDSFIYYITQSGNKVWSGAINLAWNQLKQNFLQKQNMKFYTLNKLQQKIVDIFNKQQFTKKQLSQKCYYISSGYGKRSIDRINKEVKQKFPQKSFQELNYQLNQNDFISYAYLTKDFKYRKVFSELKQFIFNNKTVQGFQATFSKQKSQLFYKYYNNQNDFLMGIQSQNSNDQIWLLKSPLQIMKNFKMQKLMKILKMSESLQNKRLSKIDKFRMPVLKFDFIRIIQQLNGVKISNKQFQGKSINKLYERLRLSVTRFGVKVQNQGAIIFGTSISFKAKYFYLNSDFWFILKQKNKLPYLLIAVHQPIQNWSN